MDACPRPDQTWPQSVPLKIIGRREELLPEMIAELLRLHLGPGDHGEGRHQANCRGPYVSFTFWVTLPDPASELTLREGFTKLPGYVMQL
ncbi:MAG: hypothetical protein HY823_01155 [Acidobacteria bacterium]|nr:hypothetical protein [Acidobacteriota bacterium]